MVGSKEAIKTNFLTKQKTFDRHLDDPNSTEGSGDECLLSLVLKNKRPKRYRWRFGGKGRSTDAKILCAYLGAEYILLLQIVLVSM